MKPEQVRNPTPEQMTAALLEAARAGQWNHWQHELHEHAGDWVTVSEMRKPMKAEQFARLPEAVAKYRFVELCVYSYKRRTVWGYYCRKLPFENHTLSGVLVVYDPLADEIFHCMRPQKGKRYCRRWGEQERFFVGVRW